MPADPELRACAPWVREEPGVPDGNAETEIHPID